MAKTKSKKVEVVPSHFGQAMENHLFIKLLIVIVISSLFLVSLIYIMDRLWSSEPYSPPFNSSMANEILKKKPAEIIPIDEEPVMCTMEYMPVCAWKADGICIGAEDCPKQTYGNKCVAGADKATIISEGECQ
jgi:hypothetical protein